MDSFLQQQLRQQLSYTDSTRTKIRLWRMMISDRDNNLPYKWAPYVSRFPSSLHLSLSVLPVFWVQKTCKGILECEKNFRNFTFLFHIEKTKF